MNLASWRDTRNRWRLQVAAVLLSRTDLSVSDIAEETGYRSPQAMARSFLRAGLPSPSEVRRLLLAGDPPDCVVARDRG
jgi:transcriptional regulator GlxA family with amidase domain